MKLTDNQKLLRCRLLTLLNNNHRSHIGSCLSVIDIIDVIYKIKKKDERFVLSNGHCAAALYIVLEKYKYLDSANLIDYNDHPDRDQKRGIDLSTGSLGQGLPIAVGMALANRNKNVYCMISDGECAEGSIWEALRLTYNQKILNLKIIASVNGWGAYDPIDSKILEKQFRGFGFKIIKINGHKENQIIKALNTNYLDNTIVFAETSSEQFPFLIGQDAHYCTMKEEDYQLVTKALK